MWLAAFLLFFRIAAPESKTLRDHDISEGNSLRMLLWAGINFAENSFAFCAGFVCGSIWRKSQVLIFLKGFPCVVVSAASLFALELDFICKRFW